MRGRLAWLALVWLAVSGCVAYEYEEEVFLEMDGSGRIRVSGSSEILAALQELDGPGIAGMRRHFEGDALEILSIRETEREGRSFLHLQGRFEDWNALCRQEAFRARDCGLERDDEEIALRTELRPPATDAPKSLDPEAVLALRFHFPSPVHYHNAPGGLERGNILSWECSLGDFFRGNALRAEARFDETSTLTTTISILLVAVLTVLVSVGVALSVLVRKGRRELAAEASARSGTPPARP